MVLVVAETWRNNGKFFSVVLQWKRKIEHELKLIVSDSLMKQCEQRCAKLLAVVFYCKPNSHLVVLVLI